MTKYTCLNEIDTERRFYSKKLLSCRLKERVLWVDLLAVLFGLGEWVAVCGVWTQLPLMVEVLPEGWKLPSYITIVIQLANSGPILYAILHHLFPDKVNEKYAPFVLYCLGNVGCFLLIFYWDKILVFNGTSRSFGLLASVFLISFVDCTSSVVFLPYMSSFKHIYLTSYLIGDGCSIFFPALVSLIQGVAIPECTNVTFVNVTAEGNFTGYQSKVVYKPPLFSVSVFYVFLLGMMLASTMAFLLLKYAPCVQGEKVSNKVSSEQDETTAIISSADTDEVHDDVAEELRNGDLKSSTSDLCDKPLPVSKSTVVYLLLVHCWLVGIFYGGVVSVQSFSVLPYGHRAYHLVITLTSIANPISACLFYALATTSVKNIYIISVLITALVSYLMTTAVYSPTPPLVGTNLGATITIIIWVVCGGLVTYVKVAIVNTVKFYHEKIFFWMGCASQIGGSIFTITMFLLVNVFNCFKSSPTCQ